jgi:hypothetical protein
MRVIEDRHYRRYLQRLTTRYLRTTPFIDRGFVKPWDDF